MDVRDAADEYIGAKRNSITAKTLRWYNYHLDRFCEWCQQNQVTDVSKITAAHVQSALTAWNAPSSYSRHGYVQVVKGFLHWCSMDEDFGVRERVVKRIELPKVEVSEVEVFTKEDIEKLLRVCKRMPNPLRSTAIVHVLLDTGVRASELCYGSYRPEEETGLLLWPEFLNAMPTGSVTPSRLIACSMASLIWC